MSSHPTTIRAAAAPTVEDCGAARTTRALAESMMQYCQRQSDAKVLRTIQAFPALANDKSLLLDLILKEYKLRQNDQSTPIVEFCQQFQFLGDSMEQSILRALEVQKYLDEHPELLGFIADFQWPVAGEYLQGFQVIEELGRGALARAYLCRESGLGHRNVVLKIARGCGYEAELLGRLDHPNIVPVYSVINDSERYLSYICMPFRGRCTLQDLVSRMRKYGMPSRASAIVEAAQLSIASDEQLEHRDSTAPGRTKHSCRGSYVDGVLYLAIQLSSALAHAHHLGVYHGDLKPSNVLLTPDGMPLLIDFNLASDRNSGAGPRGGTLAYMPPEQLVEITEDHSGRTTRYDARSEVYSFGALLYELLTGTVPFPVIGSSGDPIETVGQLLVQQKAHQPRIRPTNPHVNVQLEQLVLNCLAPNPDDRPQSMVDLYRSLTKQCGYAASVSRLARAKPALTVVLTVVASVGLIFGAIHLALRPPYQARQFANGIMLRQSQDLEAALHCFSSAMESDRLRPDALYERGRTYLQRGNGTAAMADFSRASKDYADPRSAAYVGYCFNLQGDLTSAIPWYEVALRQGHDTIGLHNNLGVSYAKGRSDISTFDRLARAQSHLEKAFELDQSSPVVRANLVMLTLVRLESDSSFDAESSLSHLRYLQTVFPRSPRVVADSVQLYSLLSMRDKNYNEEAIHAIKLSLRLGIGPSVRELSTSPRFDTLRADPRFAGIQSAAVATQIVPKRDELDMFIDPVSSAE